MTTATTVISLNRSARDAELNKISYLVCKSKTSDTGWVVVCNTDYSRCITHANDLGYCSYRGEDGLGDKIVDIMNTYKNKTIDSEKLKYIEELHG